MNESLKALCDGIIEEQRFWSEKEFKLLSLQIEDFEKRLAAAGKPLPDDLRVEKCVWYKDAKRRLQHATNVAEFKARILATVGNWTLDSPTVAQLEMGYGVDYRNQPFVQALHELEFDGVVKIEREGGTSNEVAKAIITADWYGIMIERTIFTERTPSHGYAGAICSGCKVLLADIPLSREDVSK